MTILETQFEPQHGYIPSLVIENEAGHFPMVGRGECSTPWYWGLTYDEAKATADNYNASHYGLSPADCSEICASSMFAKLDNKVSEPAPPCFDPLALYFKQGRRYQLATCDEVREIALNYCKGTPGQAIRSPSDTAEFLRLKLSHLQHELFCVVYLDNRHRVLKFAELFRGTIDGTSVYPREVVKEALDCNAAAVILAHNHPSGIAEPSQADERITKRIKAALELVDIRLLDHLIIGDKDTTSLADRGIL